MTGFIWRATIILHRYLGIAIGLLMLAWFASGAVMMYVGFPRLTEQDRTRSLAEIPWQACCMVDGAVVPDDAQFYRAQVEALVGKPVLRLRRPPRPDVVIDMSDGAAIRRFTLEDAQAIALDAGQRLLGRAAKVASADAIEEDQWTVGRYRRDRPLLRVALDAPGGSILYVSSQNGQVLLHTTTVQRFWNWLGAIPHWLYFTSLRTDGPLWSQTVIWTSIVGTFLTVLGLYLGIAQFRRGRDGRLSPYRGWFYWHHVVGLVFGIITLTFVASGLVSMNPWGFLESRGGGETPRIEGPPHAWGEIRASLSALQAQAADAVRLETAPLGGKLYWLVTGRDGTVTRRDAAGAMAPLNEGDLAAAAGRIADAKGISQQGMMAEEDTYYFGHHDGVALPVYRVVLDDEQNTRYYLDATSGALLQRADANRRWHRWLFAALHRMDFAAWLRARPAWDAIMLTLVLGGFALSATGVYLAVRRIRNDIWTLLRWLRRTPPDRREPQTQSVP